MTARDRTVAMVVGGVVLLAAFWFLALAPKRKDATALNGKIGQAQQRLDSARQQTAAASAARQRYDQDYATVAKLGKAVPADDDVASLVYQINHVSTGSHIDFRSIKLAPSGTPAAAAPAAQQAAALSSAGGSSTGSSSSSGTSTDASSSSSSSSSSSTSTDASSSSSTTSTTPSTGVPATQSAAAGLPPGSTVGSAGFPTMPFSFEFDGSFFDMEHFFTGIQRFASATGDSVAVRGRLLTVDAFALTASRFGFPKV